MSAKKQGRGKTPGRRRLATATAVLLAAIATLSACGGASSSLDLEPRPTGAVHPSTPTKVSETGVWPYDWGYGYGGLVRDLRVGDCATGSGLLESNGTLSKPAMAAAYIRGCQDAIAGRPPAFASSADFGPAPTEDADGGPVEDLPASAEAVVRERAGGTGGELVDIRSDNVRAAGYDATTGTMTVLFDSGGLYEYYDISADLWRDFLLAQPDPWSAVGYPRLVQGGVAYQRIG